MAGHCTGASERRGTHATARTRYEESTEERAARERLAAA